MDNVKQFLQGVELDKRTAALLTTGACVTGALVVLVRKVNSHREAKEKIQRARNRRAESLRRAEQAVLDYKESVRAAFLSDNKSDLYMIKSFEMNDS